MPHVPSPALPRVSVALCVYNGERWLREQLDSVLAQEGVELEVVALDDCSKDGSLALLREYAARDARVRVVANEVNLGHLKSFEKCMGLCTMPLIAPCDQDDVWDASKLATLIDAMGDADMAYCNSAYIDARGRDAGRSLADDLGPMFAGDDPLKLALKNTVSGHAMVVRSDVFESAKPLPALLFHDWWLSLRAAARNGVVYVDQPLVKFRRHADAASKAGKSAVGMEKRRSSSHNKRWLAQQAYVFEQLSYVPWFPRNVSAAWLYALLAGEDGRFSPILRVIWQSRMSLPRVGNPEVQAVRYFLRFANKIRRAKRERSFYGPLFK